MNRPPRAVRFKKAYVEITSVCNRSCAFCPPPRRPAAFLSVERFQRVIDQVAPLTDHLHFHVKGEPLVHPDLAALLDIAHGAGMKVHLVTNGTLLGPRSDLLLGHPAVHRVNVSLHAFEGTEAEQEGYLAPIFAFAHRAEAQGRPLTVLRYWRSGPSGLPPDSPLVSALEAEFPRHDHRLGKKVFLDVAEPFQWPSLEASFRSDRGFCLGLRDQVAILVDGTVVPCCLDGDGVVALGNLFETDLQAILADPRARALYNGFSSRRCVEPLCQRCGFRERFSVPPSPSQPRAR